MPLREVLGALPAGYELERGERGILAVERGRAERLARAGFGPDGGERLVASDLSGRSPLASIDAGEERWIVRSFQHGGLLRWLGERCFLSAARPFRELALAERLARAGIPTPLVVAARAMRAGPLGWKLALVTARVERSADGAEFLERMRRGELDPRERRSFLACAGELVGRLHALGFLHADLTPRNLLFSLDGPLSGGGAWVLDLDRGRIEVPLSDRQRSDNLRRLYRAVRRREARGRSFLRRADHLAFLRAYGRAAGLAGRWKEDWRSIVARDRRARLLHRLGWFLEERLGGGPGTRDGRAAVQE